MAASVIEQLEAELRRLDEQREELARGIAVVRRVLAPCPPGGTLADVTLVATGTVRETTVSKAIQALEFAGRPLKTREIANAIKHPGKSQKVRESSVYSSLKHSKHVVRVGPNLWGLAPKSEEQS